MKGIRFYQVYENKRKPATAKQEIIAVYPDTMRVCNGIVLDCISAIYFCDNSPVCYSTCSWDYLIEKCKRVSEKRAREIHPALFAYLDYEP